MGDEKGMTPTAHAEMNLVGALLPVPVFVGLLVGLFVMSRIRKYSGIAQSCAVVGMILCAAPLVLIVWGQFHPFTLRL